MKTCVYHQVMDYVMDSAICDGLHVMPNSGTNPINSCSLCYLCLLFSCVHPIFTMWLQIFLLLLAYLHHAGDYCRNSNCETRHLFSQQTAVNSKIRNTSIITLFTHLEVLEESYDNSRLLPKCRLRMNKQFWKTYF